MPPSVPIEQRHLLIMRLSAMGDVAILASVVGALRNAYPDLKITILTREFFKPFFRDIKNINFFTPDLENRHHGSRGIWRLAMDLRLMGINYVADLHDVIRTKVMRRIFRLLGLKVAIIDKGREEKKALTQKFQKVAVQLKPTIERYMETIVSLGFEDLALELPVKTARSIPKEVITLAGRKKGKWIGVAPFAQHRGKIYPTTLTDELISLLASRYDKVFLFGGGPYERDFAECMEERYPNTVSVIGKIKLGQELNLMSNLDCVVSMDSAAMHMASLMATPVVSVWGATHPFAGFYGYGQDPANAVQIELSCRPCSVYGNKPCLFKDYRCMHRISPQMIFDRVVQVVE